HARPRQPGGANLGINPLDAEPSSLRVDERPWRAGALAMAGSRIDGRPVSMRRRRDRAHALVRRPQPGHTLNSRMKLANASDSSLRRQTRIVRTGGNPEGNGRKISPGRFTSERVAVVGAMPNPAEISHILV